MKVLALFVCALALTQTAEAARFFVTDATSGPGVNRQDTRSLTGAVRNTVQSSESDTVVNDPSDADYVLQPRVIKTVAGLIVTVEKKRGNEILFAAQSKVASRAELGRAARNAALSAINEPTPSVAAEGPQAPRQPPGAPLPSGESISGATRGNPPAEGAPAVPYSGQGTGAQKPPGGAQAQQPPAQPAPPSPLSEATGELAPAPAGRETTMRASGDVWPVKRKVGYWSVGIGPFIPRRMGTNEMMYGAMIGHDWDINPRASLKVLGEASLSSGNNQARFYNVGAGASFFLGQSLDTAPYVTADIGYGFAEDARGGTGEGFSWGTGIGVRFFRLTETTMDLLLRYNVVTQTIAGGEANPSVLGVRLAVNF
jgi:hypothetical protein